MPVSNLLPEYEVLRDPERCIRCRVCALLNAADGLTRDCDLFDDGDDGNASCS